MNKKTHWENIYKTKQTEEVSWYQAHPESSLKMIEAAKLPRNAAIIDVGGGDSRLIDCLIERGYENLTILDISGEALKRAKERLGNLGQKVQWIEADITEFNPSEKFQFWHDRAVFHFLTDPKDRSRYLSVMERSLAFPAWIMIAAFAADGPKKCSGLAVQRYSHKSLQETLGPEYQMKVSDQETHLTPQGYQQKFVYTLFRKE